MQEPGIDQNPNPRAGKRKSLKLYLTLLGVALLLSLVLGAPATMNHLVPKGPGGKQAVTVRLGWYFHSGQMLADARTLGAALKYFASADSELPESVGGTNLPVAAAPGPSLPKS